jgi:hypothetical protein
MRVIKDNLPDSHTGMYFIFQESGTENLLLQTSDINVLRKILNKYVISLFEEDTIRIKGIDYFVNAFSIEPLSGNAHVPKRGSAQEGELNEVSLEAVFYLKKV